MIKRLDITNFQSHIHTEIYFSPGVNIIIGSNMTGKSAILRALRLVLYNKPQGADFVTWDTENAVVEVEYNNHVIRRVKGKHNRYVVDGSVFSSFGKGVPQEVVDVLGFSSIQVDRKVYELNFDHPHDAPFFVSETDGVKGKIFSKLGERVLKDLLLLDSSIHTANAELRLLGSEKQAILNQVAEVEGTLAGFEPLAEVEKQLDKCEQSLSRVEALEEELAELSHLSVNLLSCSQSIDSLTARMNVDTPTIDAKLAEAANLVVELSELERLQSTSVQVDSGIGQLEVSTSALQDIPILQIEEAQQTLTELEDIEAVQASMSRVVKRIQILELHQQELGQMLQGTLKSYKNLLIKAQKCPLCLRPVGEHDLDLILKELIHDASGVVSKSASVKG